MHTEVGSKQAASAPHAHANLKASGAYGSEMAYTDSGGHHVGGRALKQLLMNDQSGGEEGEEEYEEETTEMDEEEELSCERKSTVPDFPLIIDDDDVACRLQVGVL